MDWLEAGAAPACAMKLSPFAVWIGCWQQWRPAHLQSIQTRVTKKGLDRRRRKVMARWPLRVLGG